MNPLAELWGQVATAAVGIASTIGGWMFHRLMTKHDREIAEIKDELAQLDEQKASKDDLLRHVDRLEQYRAETRDSIQRMHGKMDGLRDHVDAKFDRIADLIRSRN